MKKSGFVLFLLFYLASGIYLPEGEARDLEIAVSGSPEFVIGEPDLASGAGSGLKPTYQSQPDAGVIDIKAPPEKRWIVHVRRIRPTDRLTIYVRRTSDGIGRGNVEGGEDFIPVTQHYSPFFKGIGERKGITIQYRISGATIELGPGSWPFQIHYALEEEKR